MFVDAVTAAIVADGATGRSVSADEQRRSRGPSLLRTDAGLILETLTPRELEVLRLMATGASNADIAAGLVVSVGTAKWHASHVLAKLGATSRTQALVRAQQLGLV